MALSPAGTFYHTWDKLNGWSKLALFGIALWQVTMHTVRS